MNLRKTIQTKMNALPGVLFFAAMIYASQAAAAQDRDLLYLGLPAPAKAAAQQTVQNTLETVASGEERQWRNPQGIERGYIQPLRTFKNSRNQYCREYAEELHSNNGVQQRIRVACRSNDGFWIMVLDEPVSNQG